MLGRLRHTVSGPDAYGQAFEQAEHDRDRFPDHTRLVMVQDASPMLLSRRAELATKSGHGVMGVAVAILMDLADASEHRKATQKITDLKSTHPDFHQTYIDQEHDRLTLGIPYND